MFRTLGPRTLIQSKNIRLCSRCMAVQGNDICYLKAINQSNPHIIPSDQICADVLPFSSQDIGLASLGATDEEIEKLATVSLPLCWMGTLTLPAALVGCQGDWSSLVSPDL